MRIPPFWVAAGVCFTSRPMAGRDLCHHTVTEHRARSPGWSLLLSPASRSLLLLGMGESHQTPFLGCPAEQNKPFELILTPPHHACPYAFLDDLGSGSGCRLPCHHSALFFPIHFPVGKRFGHLIKSFLSCPHFFSPYMDYRMILDKPHYGKITLQQ